jgi:putative membrane protein
MNHRHAIARPSVALGLLLLLSCSPNDDSATGSSSKKKPDQTFFDTAAQGNLAEMAAGGLARAKSTNFDVKALGERLTRDHSKAHDELSSLAEKKSILLPEKLDTAHQMEIDRLSALNGHDFDQAFAEMMVTDHQKAISFFEETAKGAGDPELRSFATSSLGMLQDHLRMARRLQETLGSPRAD